MTKQPEYRIPIGQDIHVFYGTGTDNIGGLPVRSPYRQASIGAVKDKLIHAYTALLQETHRKDGYPGTTVTACTSWCRDALLLLEELERAIGSDKRGRWSIIGKPPTHATESLRSAQRQIREDFQASRDLPKD
jgi:hypothetical protein